MPRLSYANVMSTIAVFVALGGSSYAALRITGKDVKNSSLTTKDIKNRSLLARDFKRNQLPAGPAGPAGPKGDPGPKGETGTVDTSRFYDRDASDARFLGKAEKAGDADKLDGIDSSVFGTTLTLSGSDFHPRVSALQYAYRTGGGIYATGTLPGANDRYFLSNIGLPQGARVTGVDVHYIDNSNSGSLDFFLTRYEPATLDFANLLTESSIGLSPSAQVRELTMPAAVTVDNTRYAYQLRVGVTEASANVVLAGAQVHYTLPAG